MTWIWRINAFALLLAVSAPALSAGETAGVSWRTDVTDAWRATQLDGRPLLVFVTRGNCYYCTQMKDRTYSNAQVAATINQSFVPLVLDGSVNSQLLQELHVTVFPSTFVISPQAVVMQRIDGYVPPEAMALRLNSVRPQMPLVRFAKEP